MTTPPYIDDSIDFSEIDNLLSAYCSRKITENQLHRLNELVHQDTVYRLRYVEYLDVHSELSEFAADEDITIRIHRAFAEPQSFSGHRKTLVLTISAICLFLGFIGGLYSLSHFMVPPEVATIAGANRNATWQNDSRHLGQRLVLNENIILTKGIAEIRLDTGTELSIQAPAELAITEANRIQLVRGKLQAHVPPEAIGFSLITDQMEIVDWGTEFLVHADSERKTEVLLRDGRCGARPVHRGTPVGEFRELLPGMTFQWPKNYGSALATEQEERADLEQQFQMIDRRNAGVEETSGRIQIRHLSTSGSVINSRSDDLNATLIYEGEFTLDEELQVRDMNHDYNLPAGARVKSFMIHFAPNQNHQRVEGSIEFTRPILAVICNSKVLMTTDRLFSENDYQQVKQQDRGTELDDGDYYEISLDQMTLSIGMTVPNFSTNAVDQCRVLIRANE